MERFKILGNAPQEDKELVKKSYEGHLFDNRKSLSEEDRKVFEELECPKTEKELKTIDIINKETNELLKEAGVESFEVSPDNFYILPSKVYKTINQGKVGDLAATFFEHQTIILNADTSRVSPTQFLANSLHELLHLKSYTSVQVEKDEEEIRFYPFRKGISAYASAKRAGDKMNHKHFFGLHEAIVAEQEKKSFHKLLKNQVFDEERKIMQSQEYVEAKNEILGKYSVPEDEIIWIDSKKKDFSSFGYVAARKTLGYVSEEIQKEFPEKYISKDEVFKEFLKAHLQGGLLIIAHLVEDTFGEGSFRILGNMGKEGDSAVTHLETLRQERSRFLKAKEKK